MLQKPTEIVVADIGGTHARFAIARCAPGQPPELEAPTVLKTAGHAGLEDAWHAFATRSGRELPLRASIAIAAPVHGEAIKLTNNEWVIRPAQDKASLGLERLLLINDFHAVAEAVAVVGPEYLRPICGPDVALPNSGVISVIGPGTGLGVAQLLRHDGTATAIPTEGGHICFAPTDDVEDRIVATLRARYPRISAERLLSGPGFANFYAALAIIKGEPVVERDNAALWAAALAGDDALAAAALDRFFLALGSVVGDIALAQGACGVVIAGGLGLRIADRVASSGFADRFAAKGRFETVMRRLPVKLITHPEPGLLGAAAAFFR